MSDRVSIQVLNSNRVGELDILLTSLISQSFTEWDLILLDESQTPVINHKHINDLITFIKCRGHGVIYKYQVAIYNVGKNRNECFKNDKFENEIVIRIDDDSLCDKDYIKLLVETYNDLKSKGVKVGAVGGIVPLVGAAPTYKNVPKIFNKVELDKEGNIIKMGDDGGFDYLEDVVVESHHLRSSFLFTRESFNAVNGHPLEYGFNGFREESLTKERFVTVKKNGIIEVKNIEELYNNYKDYEALTFNEEEMCSEWKPINNIIRHKNNGKKIFRVNQRHGETRCTEDHSLIDVNFEEVKPEELNTDLLTIRLIPTDNIKIFDEINMYEWFINNYNGECKIIDAGDKFRISKQGIINDFFIPKILKVNSKEFESLCRLCGAYISEGSTAKKNYYLSIVNHDKDWIELLIKDFKIFFNKDLNLLSYENLHYLRSGKLLAGIFFSMLCGQGSFNKKMPWFIYNIPKKYQELLIKNMVIGDGHIYKQDINAVEFISDKYTWMYTSSSLNLISNLSTLLSINLCSEYSIYYDKLKRSYYLRKSFDKDMKFGGRGKYQTNTKINQEEYDDYVYDIAVEGNHNFVDSCGQVVVHNTDYTFKMLFKGYKLFTRTGAKCYHLQAGGGSRNFPQEQYVNLVRINDEHFRNKVKYWFEMYGNPFVEIDPELLKFKGISKDTKEHTPEERKIYFEEFCKLKDNNIIEEVMGNDNK